MSKKKKSKEKEEPKMVFQFRPKKYSKIEEVERKLDGEPIEQEWVAVPDDGSPCYRAVIKELGMELGLNLKVVKFESS